MAGEHVYVVGGANSAGQAALHLARFAARVALMVRGESLAASMSDYLITQLEATPNVDVRSCTRVADGHGQTRLEALTLEDAGPAARQVPAVAVFVMIGARATDKMASQPQAGRSWLHPDRPRRPSGVVTAETRALAVRNEPAGRVRGRRHPVRLGQTRRRGRRRGLGRRWLRPPVPHRTMTRHRNGVTSLYKSSQAEERADLVPYFVSGLSTSSKSRTRRPWVQAGYWCHISASKTARPTTPPVTNLATAE